jgi:hypothetical protein
MRCVWPLPGVKSAWITSKPPSTLQPANPPGLTFRAAVWNFEPENWS